MSCCGGKGRSESQQAQDTCPDGSLIRATPDAHNLALQRGVDLCGVSGTGADGLIRAVDVRAVSGG